MHGIARLLLLYGVVLASGGIPLIYLGDEVATLNDHGWQQDPHKASDSRWLHRPPRDAARHAQRRDPSTPAGRMFSGLTHLISLRRHLPGLAGGLLTPFWTRNPSVLGFTRGDPADAVLVFANFSEQVQRIAPEVLAAQPMPMVDLVDGSGCDPHAGLVLAPYQQRWLRPG